MRSAARLSPEDDLEYVSEREKAGGMSRRAIRFKYRRRDILIHRTRAIYPFRRAPPLVLYRGCIRLEIALHRAATPLSNGNQRLVAR